MVNTNNHFQLSNHSPIHVFTLAMQFNGEVMSQKVFEAAEINRTFLQHGTLAFSASWVAS